MSALTDRDMQILEAMAQTLVDNTPGTNQTSADPYNTPEDGKAITLSLYELRGVMAEVLTLGMRLAVEDAWLSERLISARDRQTARFAAFGMPQEEWAERGANMCANLLLIAEAE